MRNSKVLLGIGLFGIALASLGLIRAKLNVAKAQDDPNNFSKFQYTGLTGDAETLYAINFSGLTAMEIMDGNVFSVSQVPVVVNPVATDPNVIDTSVNTVEGENSNILGGDYIKVGKSDNITIIGGYGNDEGIIGDSNNNATFLGGSGNRIVQNGFVGVAPSVLLGGRSNYIEGNHDAGVIVGGTTNTVHGDSENVSILGGDLVNIGGTNVIAGGSNINGELNDAFVFNGSEGTFDVDEGGAFYLNVDGGVGFGAAADGNGGVVSSGAVNFGDLDIDKVDCLEVADNVGLQGMWNGCLVGCTEESQKSGVWEMLDQGSYCADMCDASDKCVQEKLEPEVVRYTSFCTEGLVDTGNSTICNSEGVNSYENMIFETYLIDSEDEDSCANHDDPDNLDGHNQCVYQCNKNYHLTGDDTGMYEGITKCFSDCTLPRDKDGTLPKMRHNQLVTGYDVTDVSTEGALDHCGKHKHTLICVNGTWYEADSNNKASVKNERYIYGTCTLNAFKCDDSEYELNREQIINKKEDFMGVWDFESIEGDQQVLDDFLQEIMPVPRPWFKYVNFKKRKTDKSTQTDRSQQKLVRGTYKLCIDYVPGREDNTELTSYSEAPENELIFERPPLPIQYHYHFEKCNDGYTLAEKDGVCRKNCQYRGQQIKHGESVKFYTGTTATCNDTCHAQDFECYDGTFYLKGQSYPIGEFIYLPESYVQLQTQDGKFVQGTAQGNTVYTESNCTLNPERCNGYPTTHTTYTNNQSFGLYNSCQRYNTGEVYPFKCVTSDMMYKLQYCYSGHYAKVVSSNQETCPFCPDQYYTNGTGSTVKSDCKINCTASTHVNAVDKICEACAVGKYTLDHTVSAGSTSSCSDCTKPGHSHFTSNGKYKTGCNWLCDDGYYNLNASNVNPDGTYPNACTICPAGYYCQGGSQHACPSAYPSSDAGATGANNCYRLITVTFNKNGNSGYSGTQTCNRYNNGSAGCSITAPSITSSAGFTVIGWSTSASSHVNNWTPGESKVFSANATYYAQTYYEFHRTAKFYKNGSSELVGGAYENYYPVQCTVTGYNGDSTVGCNVTSLEIRPGNGFTALGYNTDSNAHTSTWNQNSSKYITGTVYYYAIRKKDITGTFIKGTGVSSLGQTSATCTIWNTATTCDITVSPTITCLNGYGTPKGLTPSALTGLSSDASATATCSILSYTCAAGKYLKANQTTCSNCEAGYYCQGGTWNLSGSAQGRSQCSGRTKYSSSSASACSTVSAGYYTIGCDRLGNKCTGQTKCEAGNYCTNGEKIACSTLGSNYTGSAAGSSINTKCYMRVSGGKYKTSATGNTTSTCNAGYAKSAHNSYYGSTDSCNKCVKSTNSKTGTYSSRNGESSCTNCAHGTYTSTAGAIMCNTCPEGYYCPSGKLIGCPSGKRSGAGSYDSSDCKSDCSYDGSSYHDGDTVQAYPSNSSVGSACSKVTFTCDDGNWKYNNQNTTPRKSCTTYCPESGACGSLAAGYSCSTYSTSSSSSCSCDSYMRTSTCSTNGTRSQTPYSYGSCSNNGCGSQGNGTNRNSGNYTPAYTCFLAGTQVLTPDGSKNIEDIKEGDLVLSYNVLTEETEYNKVSKRVVYENATDDIYTITVNGEKIEATELHPFYVVGENGWPYQCHQSYRWENAKNLKVGDELLMSNGNLATIEDISHRSFEGTTYNLNVENAHTYFVGKGYLVHNVAPGAAGNSSSSDSSEPFTNVTHGGSTELFDPCSQMGSSWSCECNDHHCRRGRWDAYAQICNPGGAC